MGQPRLRGGNAGYWLTTDPLASSVETSQSKTPCPRQELLLRRLESH